MKLLLLALSGIVLISLGLFQNSYAMWPFDNPQPIDPNKVTVRQADSIITYDKGTNKGSWESAPKWILDYNDYQGNPVYAPYKVWDAANYVTFENAQSSVTVEKNTCSLRIFDGGRVLANDIPLLNAISFNLQNAVNGTDVWNESPENFAPCDVKYSTDSNGLIANLVQGSSVQKNIELRLYDNKVPELILKVTNNDYSNISTKYGFAVLISNSSNTVIDGDLIKFQDSNNKTVLVFDTQNTINHYLWTVKRINGGIILDYKNAKGPLEPGKTLEIDPTFTASPSPNTYQFKTGASASDCNTYSTTATSASTMTSFDLHGSSNGCAYSAAEFDITDFPRTAIVNTIQMTGALSSGGSTCAFVTEPNRPSTTPGATMFAQLKTATPYVTGVSCNVGTTKVSLGTNAINNFTTSYTNNWYAVGFNAVSAGTSVSISSTQLMVNYTLPVPNAVTGVSCSPTQALGNTCTWNNATSIGGKVQGFYVTRNSTAEPLYSSALIGYWKFDGLSTTNKITDYGSSNHNATFGSGTFQNKTGIVANANNFTGTSWLSAATTNLPGGSVDRTVSMWLNMHTCTADYVRVVSWGTYTVAHSDNGYMIGSPACDKKIYFYDGTSLLGSTGAISLDHWEYLTWVISNSASNLKIYINGTLDSSQAIPGVMTTGATYFNIAASGGGSNIIPASRMDDLRIYNKALSQSEITTLYNYRLNSALSKLDTYILKDGHTYNYCIYPVNQYGQNDTGNCATGTAKNYAPPPNQLNGKFYKDGSNHYNVQINWSKPSQFLGDTFLATGYKVQKLVGSTWTTVLSNTTSTTYTDSSLQNTTTQKYRVFSNNHFGTSPGYIFENTNGTGLKTLYQFENNTLDSRGTNTVAMTRDDNYTSGIIGYSLALNGTQYGKSTATGVPNGTSDRAVSLWIKPSSFSTNSNGYLGTGTSAANSEFAIIDANGKIDCGGAGNNVNSTTTLTANHWALVTCVLSNTGQTRSIYINGTLDKTSTTTAINSAATNLYIGTRPDNTNRNVTGLIDNVRIYNTALNSTFVSELYNEAITSKDNAVLAGTHTLTFVTVGDVTRATSHLTITTGFPPPTVTNWHLYNASTIYNSTNVSTSVVSNVPATFLYGNYFNVDILHNFKAVARVSNGTATTLINSTVYPIQYAYLPTYKTTSGVNWNYTVTRPAPATNMSLLANENPILFTMKCQIQTASDAAAGKGTGWYNQSNVGYFLQSITVHNYDNMYGTCYTSGGAKLFTFVSYGNSSLFPAINFMNTSYGAYIGVPVGVVFIVMAAALGNRRTAPMWVVIILAMAGIMATVGFFTLNAGVWALALIAGLLALFVGKKLF